MSTVAIRDYNQIATAGADTAAGSKFSQNETLKVKWTKMLTFGL